MDKISLAQAQSLAYAKIGIDLTHENRPVIMDELTLDFDWGFVFYYNGKKWMETGHYEFGYIGNLPVLVDKFDGTTQHVGGIANILDSQLEAYRVSKGYPAGIKFPIGEDISHWPLLDQVRELFRTGEIAQIKRGAEMARSNQLFDLEDFAKIIYNNAFPNWNFEEQIAAQFTHESVILNSGIGSRFPVDFKIFGASKVLSLNGVQLDAITDEVLQLPNLERIQIWSSTVDQITPKINTLRHLNYVEILDSHLGEQAEAIVSDWKRGARVEVCDYRKS